MAFRTMKKLLFVAVSITCVIYVGRLVLPTCFKPQETETQTVSSTTPSGKRSVSEIDLLWPMLGGLRDAKINDLDEIRRFFKDRPPTKWKLILRVGVGNLNFNALKWSDGWEHLRDIDCPVTNCQFTSNSSALDSADALVISNYGKGHEKVLTPKRRHQVWIAQILEPPMMVKIHSNLVKGLVNWTATYRRDSTITIPYGVWTKTEPKSNPSRKNYAHGKTKKVAMFVSNCKAISGRVEYAIELNKSIQVDIFGKCGHLNCSKYQECHAMLKKDYKFYLSFENSNCVGYMTEKFHLNALNNDIVPVVMGARREDYVAAAPPHSFVHVDDFLSPGHLGKYLNLLDSNDALYNEYFHYKGRYRLHMYWTLGSVYWCQVCTRLHLMEHETLVHWYDDFNRWWVDACAPKYDRSGWRTWNETFES